MIVHELGKNSRVKVIPFDSLRDAAKLTLAFLQKNTVALSGGTTYASLYPLWLALKPSCRFTRFYPVDERKAPFESPESNWGTASRAFLNPLGHHVDSSNVALDAEQYRRKLQKDFGTGLPVFDTVFLGVGNDGHTASLFPKSPALRDKYSLVLDTESPKPPAHRITMGLSILSAARSLVTIVSGEGKKEIGQRIFKNDMTLPIVRVLASREESFLFVQRSILPPL